MGFNSYSLIDEGKPNPSRCNLTQLHHEYDNSIQEESVYEFETFKVSRNGYKYKATNHPYRTIFTSKTFCATVGICVASITLMPLCSNRVFSAAF